MSQGSHAKSFARPRRVSTLEAISDNEHAIEHEQEGLWV
jgi:hypothetical protein